MSKTWKIDEEEIREGDRNNSSYHIRKHLIWDSKVKENSDINFQWNMLGLMLYYLKFMQTVTLIYKSILDVIVNDAQLQQDSIF